MRILLFIGLSIVSVLLIISAISCGSGTAGGQTTSTGLTSPNSSKPSGATPGFATKLVYTTQPGGGKAGSPLEPQPVVSVLDANGNIVTNSTATVTLIISSVAGGTISGIKTVDAVNGVATFASVAINEPGTGYVLTAMSRGLSSAKSNTFDVSP